MTILERVPFSYFIYLKQSSSGIYKYINIHTYIHIIYSFIHSINFYYSLHNYTLDLPMTNNESLYHLELHKHLLIITESLCDYFYLFHLHYFAYNHSYFIFPPRLASFQILRVWWWSTVGSYCQAVCGWLRYCCISDFWCPERNVR